MNTLESGPNGVLRPHWGIGFSRLGEVPLPVSAVGAQLTPTCRQGFTGGADWTNGGSPRYNAAMSLEEGDEGRAFVVLRGEEGTQVHDLVRGEDMIIGSARGSTVCLQGAGVARRQVVLNWDGKTLRMRDAAAGTVWAGKEFVGAAELKPGDELSFGQVQMVVGVNGTMAAGGRRVLTHHEFRERLYEELARAVRGGRPTSLVMIATRSGDGGQVTAAALDSFRAGDLVGTYGPDEIEVLLPDTDRDAATRVVGRVLDSTSAVAGIAVAPVDGDTPEGVFWAARQALAEAQRQGRGVCAPPEILEPRSADIGGLCIDESVLTALRAVDGAALLTGEASTGKTEAALALCPEAETPAILRCAAIGSRGAPRGIEDALEQLVPVSFLVADDIGELSREDQAELWRWVQEHPEVRVVATTQRALGGLVDRGAFLGELYGAFQESVIEMPALRNRPSVILPLAQRFAKGCGAPVPVQIAAAAVARLYGYPWPGNVLELRNAMERAVRLARGGEILAEHLPSEPLPVDGGDGRLREHVDSVERDAIIKALADSNHNQTHAAKRLGVSRRALIYKMEKYGLKKPPKGQRKSTPPGRRRSSPPSRRKSSPPGS